MRVIHKNTGATASDQLQEARDFEKAGDLEEAAGLYKKVIKLRPGYEPAYDRLMIIYRKLKEYEQELDLINKAIKIFTEMHESVLKVKNNRQVNAISNKLLKSLDLVDKKGKPLYEAEPMRRWNKRKRAVEKKIQND
jgi:tetratricopeptide (TPR) repeat protein